MELVLYTAKRSSTLTRFEILTFSFGKLINDLIIARQEEAFVQSFV